MRFARQARIFRGTLDPAAVAGVFLLLLIFLVLGALIHTPGVLIDLGGRPVVRITQAGIIFGGKTYDSNSMQELGRDLQRSHIRPPYTYQREAGAPASAVDRLRALVQTPDAFIELGNSAETAAPAIRITRAGGIVFDGKTYTVDSNSMQQLRQDLQHSQIRPPYTYQREPGAPAAVVDPLRALVQIEPPVGANLTGSDNPTVTVEVNFLGQCFFENQLVSEAQLKEKLKDAVAQYKRHSKELDLILYEDKATENQVQVRLEQLAREAGIKNVLLAAREGVVAAPAPNPRPKP